MKKAFLLFLTLGMALTSCKSSKHGDLGDGVFADIQTNKGDIILRLEYEKTPVTVANFVSLAEGNNPFVAEEYKNKPYYDGLIFHRVMKDFMIQGGDPLGTGSGNPGYKFMDEFNDSLLHDRKGILSMANAGPTTNGSQFFITHAPTPWLNGRHTIFGEVVEGMAVVDSIANVPVGGANRPVDSIIMNKVEIIRIGKEAKKFDAVALMTDYFDKEGERLAAIEKENAEKAVAAEKVKMATAMAITADKAKANKLPSGLNILTIQEGSGEQPKLGQQVLVKYAGYLEDGTLFDSNYQEVATAYNVFDWNREQGGGYEAMPMLYSTESQLIAGFREGLLTMKVGDKVRLFIPPHLGYGEQGGGPIPPSSNLVFDVEITGIAQ
ncbi:MAG: peptidylprolyl isomerase [Flavobacteriaceae bacterium]